MWMTLTNCPARQPISLWDRSDFQATFHLNWVRSAVLWRWRSWLCPWRPSREYLLCLPSETWRQWSWPPWDFATSPSQLQRSKSVMGRTAGKFDQWVKVSWEVWEEFHFHINSSSCKICLAAPSLSSWVGRTERVTAQMLQPRRNERYWAGK